MKFTARNISFTRHHRLLLNNINCELTPGQCLQVQGANGSGKSTLLRIFSGFIQPTQGETNVCQQQLHYLGHHHGIKPYLTVAENIALQTTLFTSAATSTLIIQSLQLIHVKTIPAQYLSAGQQRRLSFAKLLLQQRPLWILDEPTTALDQAGQEYFTELLTQHLTNQGIAIIATHQPLSIDAGRKQCLML